MQYVNANMDAIIALANEIDRYQEAMRRIQNQLGQQFSQLEANGQWTDARYGEFRKSYMEPLGNELAALHNAVDNDLKPFLHDVYQKLTEYRDA
jgi:hypothetical protein